MKKLMGRKSVLMCLLGMMVILLGATAQAALITGGISFGAHVAPTLTGGTTLLTNTGFAWPAGSNAHVAAGTGDFSTFATTTQDTTFSDFTFSLLLPGTLLWTIDSTSDYFTMASAPFISRSPSGGSISIEGTGTFYFAGFEPTLGTFVFQSNVSGDAFTFSSSATAIPEPGTLILLGSGLLGLALTGARKNFRK